MKKTSLKLQKNLEDLRIRALEEGRDAQALVAELIEAYLRKKSKGGSDAR